MSVCTVKCEKIEVRMVFSSVVKSFLTDQGHTPVKTFCQNRIFFQLKSMLRPSYIFFDCLLSKYFHLKEEPPFLLLMNLVPRLKRVPTLLFYLHLKGISNLKYLKPSKWGHPTVFEIDYWNLVQKPIFSLEPTLQSSRGEKKLVSGPSFSSLSQKL